MRTTIDLPDVLFREVKATAASRGLKMKEFIACALRGALQTSTGFTTEETQLQEAHRHRMLRHFQRMVEGRKQTGSVGELNRDSLHDRDV